MPNAIGMRSSDFSMPTFVIAFATTLGLGIGTAFGVEGGRGIYLLGDRSLGAGITSGAGFSFYEDIVAYFW